MARYQRETKYGRRLSFAVSPELLEGVEAAAAKEKMSVASMVRRCIAYALPKLKEQRRSKERRTRSQRRSE